MFPMRLLGIDRKHWDHLTSQDGYEDRDLHWPSPFWMFVRSPVQVAISRAAVAFGTDLIPTAGHAEVNAAQIRSSRGIAALPEDCLTDPPPTRGAMDALSRLKAGSTPGGRQMRGPPPLGWWSNAEDLQRAAEMRLAGATWVAISRMLGVTPDAARRRLVRHGGLDPVLTRIRPAARRWTAEERAAAKALRERGCEWGRIAALIGRPSGLAVQQSVWPTGAAPKPLRNRNQTRPSDWTRELALSGVRHFDRLSPTCGRGICTYVSQVRAETP